VSAHAANRVTDAHASAASTTPRRGKDSAAASRYQPSQVCSRVRLSGTGTGHTIVAPFSFSCANHASVCAKMHANARTRTSTQARARRRMCGPPWCSPVRGHCAYAPWTLLLPDTSTEPVGDTSTEPVGGIVSARVVGELVLPTLLGAAAPLASPALDQRHKACARRSGIRDAIRWSWPNGHTSPRRMHRRFAEPLAPAMTADGCGKPCHSAADGPAGSIGTRPD
jgi:hypothetical protein